MQRRQYFSLLIIIIIIILSFNFYNSFNPSNSFNPYNSFSNPSVNEGFTTKLGGIYRPYIRKARLFSENFYNNTTGGVSTFFRKIGLA